MQILSKRILATDPIKIKDLDRAHAGSFAILTSYRRPDKSISENKPEYRGMLEYLDSKGYKYKQAKGFWGSPEKSVMIENMPYAEAKRISEEYNQDGFIHKNPDGPVTLYHLKQKTAKPLEKIDMATFDNDPDAKKRLKTKFRNIGLNYDFSKRPFELSEGPLTWLKLEDKAHAYEKALALQNSALPKLNR